MTDRHDPSATALTVWHYGSAMGASAGEVRLRDLEARGALTVIDAITVLWMPGASKPRVGRFRSRAGAAARRGAVLGALAGTLVLAPVAGAAAGAAVGGLAGRLRHTGIDEPFLAEIERRLVPGTSALLVLSENPDVGEIGRLLERGRTRGDVTLMHAELSADAPQTLRELLEAVPSFASDSPVSEDPPRAASPLASGPDASSGRSRPLEETPS